MGLWNGHCQPSPSCHLVQFSSCSNLPNFFLGLTLTGSIFSCSSWNMHQVINVNDQTKRGFLAVACKHSPEWLTHPLLEAYTAPKAHMYITINMYGCTYPKSTHTPAQSMNKHKCTIHGLHNSHTTQCSSHHTHMRHPHIPCKFYIVDRKTIHTAMIFK